MMQYVVRNTQHPKISTHGLCLVPERCHVARLVTRRSCMTRLILRLCTFLCFSLLVWPVGAQIRSGTITGSVTDPSGALVADADVVATTSASATKAPLGSVTEPVMVPDRI